MKVKICGITNIDDANLCAELGADALGFIFYNKSKRYIDFESAKEIIDSLPFFIFKVGVFVNEDVNKVNRAAAELKLNAVQLHGDEDLDYCKQVNHPVIKAIRVDNNLPEQLNIFNNYTILLDKKSDNEYGGTGDRFNWNIIPNPVKNKIILAGGVSVENIEKIYNEISPQAVDLSSSLESSSGKKDHQKVNEFFAKLNKLRNQQC